MTNGAHPENKSDDDLQVTSKDQGSLEKKQTVLSDDCPEPNKKLDDGCSTNNQE